MNGINERIKILIPALGYNKSAFGKAMGYNYNAVIENIVGKRQSKPGYEFLNTLLTTFKRVNPTWLMTGEGEMLITGLETSAVLAANEKDIIKAPLISQFAYAGYLRGFGDADYVDSQPTYFSTRRYSSGHYIAFEIRGESMDDGTKQSICNGDIVLGRELSKEYWRSKLNIPKVFIIIHQTEGITCKEVIDHNVETGEITCHSWNKDPEYIDFKINMENVLQMFYIKEVSRSCK